MRFDAHDALRSVSRLCDLCGLCGCSLFGAGGIKALNRSPGAPGRDNRGCTVAFLCSLCCFLFNPLLLVSTEHSVLPFDTSQHLGRLQIPRVSSKMLIVRIACGAGSPPLRNGALGGRRHHSPSTATKDAHVTRQRNRSNPPRSSIDAHRARSSRRGLSPPS